MEKQRGAAWGETRATEMGGESLSEPWEVQGPVLPVCRRMGEHRV